MITKILLAINAVVYLLWLFAPKVTTATFGLFGFGNPNQEFYQFITYQFVHGGTLHFILNMVGLLSVGFIVEKRIGGFNYLFLYLTSGVLGALLHLFFVNGNVCLVGASGAIYGLFGAVAMLRPNLQMILIIFPFFPIKVKYLFPLILLFDLCMAIFSGTSKVGHWCHVGGGIVGVFMALACADFASRSYGDEDE